MNVQPCCDDSLFSVIVFASVLAVRDLPASNKD
jgi:hypothetical protein